jgi:REP element-mobilizing transposase RayT
MAHPPRQFHPEHIQHVSNRCQRGKYLFHISGPKQRELYRIACAMLCRTAHKYNIYVFAFILMANHFHLALAAPDDNLDDFMRDFQGQLARRINDVLGREDTVFPRRYKSKLLDGRKAFENAMAYILTNACHHGVVDDPAEYRGPSNWCHFRSVEQGRQEGFERPEDMALPAEMVASHGGARPAEDRALVGYWLDHRKYRLIQRRKVKPYCRSEAFEVHRLEMARPGYYPDKSDEEYRAFVRGLAAKKLEKLEERGQTGSVAELQDEKIDREAPRPRPHTGPMARVAASTPSRIIEHRQVRRRITKAYRKARARVRDGEPWQRAGFPRGTYPAGVGRCIRGGEGEDLWAEFHRGRNHRPSFSRCGGPPQAAAQPEVVARE